MNDVRWMQLLVLCAVAALLLAACGGDSDDGSPGSTATDATAAGTPQPGATLPDPFATPPPGDPNVFGRVELAFTPYGDNAEQPEGPIEMSLLVRPISGTQSTRYPVDDDGSFGLHAEPGEYEVAGLQLENESLASGPFLHSTGGPVFSVPDSGCVYIGDVTYSLYRLEAGEVPNQFDMMEEIEEETGQDLDLLFLDNGGLIQFDQSVAESAPPEGGASCDSASGVFE